MKKIAGGLTTNYVWEGSHVIAEYNGATGALIAEYVYAGARMLAEESGGTVKYYHQDRLSARVLTDVSGNIAAQMSHEPFGEQLVEREEVNKWRFTSYERDSETGSDYAISRQHQYAVGRFMRPDPVAGSIADPQSLNRYAYVANDPVNATDPLGLFLDASGCQTFVSGTLYYWKDTGKPVAFFITGVTTVCPVFGGFRASERGSGGGTSRNATRAGQAYRRPGKAECAQAMAELGSIVKEFGQKFTYAIMYGQDAGHYKKMSQLKNGITSALDKVKSTCFDKNGGPRFPDLTGGGDAQSALQDAENIVNDVMKIPDVGTQGMDFTSMKIGAALGAIGGALSATGRAIGAAGKAAWQWVLGH